MKRILFALALLAIPFTANAQMTPGDIPAKPYDQALREMTERVTHLGHLRSVANACDFRSMYYALGREVLSELVASSVHDDDIPTLTALYQQEKIKVCPKPADMTREAYIDAMSVIVARETGQKF